MVDVVLLTYEIESGATDRLREWLGTARVSGDDSIELLEAEGMLTESMFIRESESGHELVWYQEAEDIERAMEVYEAAEGELIEESKRLFADVLVGGLEEPSEMLSPELHLANPAR